MAPKSAWMPEKRHRTLKIMGFGRKRTILKLPVNVAVGMKHSAGKIMSTQHSEFGFGTQIRKSPFFDATVRWGAKDFSVYNHMYIPRDFGDPEQNFWNLVNEAILCDVAVERQVEITGPDAARFVQMLTPRDLSKCAVGQCKYVLITNAEEAFSTTLFCFDWPKIIFGCPSRQRHFTLGTRRDPFRTERYDSRARCFSLQLQGPKSGEIVKALFGRRFAI